MNNTTREAARPAALTRADLDARVTITPDEAFATVGVGRTAGYALLRDGTIPSRRLGKRYVIPAQAFSRFLSETGTASA
ncbi:helix-turn-helix domain-containing protein [Flexivirga sp. B27]